MFGINTNELTWMAQTIQWIVNALQAIAIKLGVSLPKPPEPPSSIGS